MPAVTFLWFSKDQGDRVFGMVADLRRIAEDHNVSFHVRSKEEDPDPEPEDEQEAEPDPVRVAEGVTIPKDVVDQLRRAANHAGVHIYVNPPTHE